MSRTRSRSGRNRLIGKELLRLVDSYEIENGDMLPVTAARKFITENKLRVPALISVKKNSITSERFLWAEEGVFGAVYVEFNWLLFPCLQKIYRENIDSIKLAALDELDLMVEIEKYRPEYSFI